MKGVQTKLWREEEMQEKVAVAIRRLRAFEPPEGYWLAFSGGKDSQCIYHLAKQAGVKFEPHYTVTTIDPPRTDAVYQRQLSRRQVGLSA